jgi:hypothetical protein
MAPFRIFMDFYPISQKDQFPKAAPLSRIRGEVELEFFGVMVIHFTDGALIGYSNEKSSDRQMVFYPGPLSAKDRLYKPYPAFPDVILHIAHHSQKVFSVNHFLIKNSPTAPICFLFFKPIQSILGNIQNRVALAIFLSFVDMADSRNRFFD